MSTVSIPLQAPFKDKYAVTRTYRLVRVSMCNRLAIKNRHDAEPVLWYLFPLVVTMTIRLMSCAEEPP
jgi:hypothetical protein